MKINRILIVLGLSTIYYALWQLGFDYVWAYILKGGISTITASFSGIKEVLVEKSETAIHLYFKYVDRNNDVNVEYALPIVLLLGWQTYLLIMRDIPRRFAFRSAAFNLILLYLFQIFFPLLLYNVSASKTKATLFFMGLQVFGMLILFLIVKDNVILKYRKINTQAT